MISARRAIRVETRPRRLAGRAPRPSSGKRCTATARSGRPCQAPPLRGKTKCAFHSGNRAVICGQRGGRRRAIFNPEGLEPIPTPRDVQDLLRLVMQTVVEVRAQKIDTKTATAVFYGCGVGKSVLEVADLDLRLKALEGRHDELEKQRRTVQ